MELVNITYTGTGGSVQDLSSIDGALITSNYINAQFGSTNDVLELHIYGENGQLLQSDYNALDYYPSLSTNSKTGLYSSLILDPEKDVKNRGFNRGTVNAQYNFFNNLFGSSNGTKYWIKEISRSRTELKLASQVLADFLIKSNFQSYDSRVRTKNYYPIFYLNFGNNDLVVANNALYTEDGDGAYLLIKLYEPLPSNYDIKSQLWIVDKVAESANFQISIDVQVEEEINVNSLRGPNYNVAVNTKTGQSTPYYNYNDLLVSPVTSSFQKLNSFYQDKAVAINVDYSNFSNFIKFSSATERVNNFVYKLGLIETSKANIVSQASIVGGPYSSVVTLSSSATEQRIIDNIISNFDTYEYFLYFNSSSWAWPKRNSTQPYELYSVTSSQATNFIGSESTIPTATTASLLFSASYYDSTNKDVLRNTAPQYILDDPSNQPFVTFLDMIGQHFDNLWIYYKDVTNRFNATNNPNTGISLDLVSDALKGLGFQLFTNTNVSDNLYYTLFGINADGSLLPPTGSEQITNYVTSSLTTLPAEQIQDEYYKRLYHNLPYLYKTKGTLQGLKALISIYGIPEEILSVREFGGNVSGSLKGIIDLGSSDFKVNIVTGSGGIVTGSLQISSSVLSPYTTIQYYDGNTRLNNATIEVGFSPSDVVNNNITSSLSVNVEQLIGSPGYLYSYSYTPLVSASNAYFSNYTQRNSIWEYIRLLKFYNNSLFKTIKEFVPARANVSTGVIIKSHMLERNKYARHEPSMSFQNYSQSIDIGYVSASFGGCIDDSTSWQGFLVTPVGALAYTSSNGIEKYNGEFSGSLITVTDGLAIQQADYIKYVTGSVATYNYGALYQNISGAVRSTRLLDLDYSTNQITPVNYGAVTYSLNLAISNNYSAYLNKNNPFAEVQDYNYNIKRSTDPRYAGSRVSSIDYNTYTEGDISYGKTAAIDKIKYQYAYIVNIFSASFQMPGRAKGQIKYLIDNNQNVINLSKANTNWFTVQNVFKSGETADVSLFDYDPTNPYVQRLNNSENDFTVWESGYSYTPLMYNNSGSLTYNLTAPIVSTTAGSSTTYTTILGGNANYWILSGKLDVTPVGAPSYIGGKLSVTGSTVGSSPSTADVYITCTINNVTRGGSYSFPPFTIPKGTANASYKLAQNISPFSSDYYSWLPSDTYTVTTGSEQTVTTGTVSINTYISSSVDSSTAWSLREQQNILWISPTQSLYYGQFISSGSYTGLDAFVFPFNINVTDIVRLYNYSTSRWDQGGEFRVTSVSPASSASIDYYALTLDRPVAKEYTSGSAPNGSYPFSVYKYLVLKRLQDETSVYFNYDLPQAITQEGTLFPQYIGEGVKEGSGNVIKALKQQNLI